MFARKQRSIVEHFAEDAADRPDINRLRVTFRIQHDFRCTIPSKYGQFVDDDDDYNVNRDTLWQHIQSKSRYDRDQDQLREPDRNHISKYDIQKLFSIPNRIPLDRMLC